MNHGRHNYLNLQLLNDMATADVLVIGFVWPEPKSSAAGSRILQIIQLFQEQEWRVTFACAAMDSDFMFSLESIGVTTKKIKLNDSSFDNFIKELQPSIVLFDRFMIEEQFGWRVAENCPYALRILDTEDLHCLRHARQLAWKQNRNFEISDLFSDIAKREVASILRCDISLMISEFEMQLLQNVFKVDGNLLHYLPFLLYAITPSRIAQWPSFEIRKDFIFIGNFLHEPNWNAVLYLKTSVWPIIRKYLPKANLQIYGAYPSQKVLQMHQPNEGFNINGRALDAQEVVQHARVVLAPLRFGAGIKGKLVEAMWCGTPSVTTTIGAEAMQGDSNWNGFVTDDLEDFAAFAVRLHQEKELWQKAQNDGVLLFNSRYLKSIFGPALVQRIQKVRLELQTHRQENFTGALLMHHSMSSTKYMSRWIEEKNK